MFDAVRDAALAIKALGRWDLVVQACLKCFRELDEAFVKAHLNARPGDDFPFRWLFPVDGFKKRLNQTQEKLLAETRAKLFSELRRVLDLYEKATLLQASAAPLAHAAPRVSKADENYKKRLREISCMYEPVLQECSKMFALAHAFTSFQTNPRNMEKLRQAQDKCRQILDHMHSIDNLTKTTDLEKLVKHIEWVISFKQLLVDSAHVRQARAPPKKRSRAELEEIERAATQIAAKVQRMTKK
jgi:hypothetical protein